MAEPLRFRSAVGRSFLIIVSTALSLGPVIVAVSAWRGKTPVSELPGVFLFMALPAIFIYVLYRATEYVIDEQHLIVRGGIVNSTVPLSEIRTVRASNSLMSAPAFSFDRIEVGYGRFDTVIVSPDDKAGFVSALERRCPRATFQGLDDVRRRSR